MPKIFNFTKKTKIIFAFLIGALVLIGGSYTIKQSHAESLKKEHDEALIAIEATLEMSKTLKKFYNCKNADKLIEIQREFSIITHQLNNLKKLRKNNKFVKTVRKASEFFHSFCSTRIDQLNKLSIMKLDISLNNHVDTSVIEKMLKSKKEYSAHAYEMEDDIIQSIPKAFASWNNVLSPEDCHEVFGYIDKNFVDEKKKSHDLKEKKQESNLYTYELIALTINEEVFYRWMSKEMKDIINKIPAHNEIKQDTN